MVGQILDRFGDEDEDPAGVEGRRLLGQAVRLGGDDGCAEEAEDDEAADGAQGLVRELCGAVLVKVGADDAEGEGADADRADNAVDNSLLDAGEGLDVGGDVVLGAGVLGIDLEAAVFPTADLGDFFAENFDDVVRPFPLTTPVRHDLTRHAVDTEKCPK